MKSLEEEQVFFIKAIRENDIWAVKQCLAKKMELNFLISDSFTFPLYEAVSQENFALVQLLLENKADINLKRLDFYTVLFAVRDMRTLQYLIKCGANVNPNPPGKPTPLHRLAACGTVEEVKLLLKAGALVDRKNHKNQLPIYWTRGSMSSTQNEKYNLLETITNLINDPTAVPQNFAKLKQFYPEDRDQDFEWILKQNVKPAVKPLLLKEIHRKLNQDFEQFAENSLNARYCTFFSYPAAISGAVFKLAPTFVAARVPTLRQL